MGAVVVVHLKQAQKLMDPFCSISYTLINQTNLCQFKYVKKIFFLSVLICCIYETEPRQLEKVTIVKNVNSSLYV